MLVLTRLETESFIINGGTEDQFEIQIKKISGNRASVLFDAPKHIKIQRKEVFLRVQEEQKQIDSGEDQPCKR